MSAVFCSSSLLPPLVGGGGGLQITLWQEGPGQCFEPVIVPPLHL